MTTQQVIEHAAENAYLKLFSRILMLSIIPIMGWIWTAGYSTVRNTAESEQKDRTDLLLLSQTVSTMQLQNSALQADINNRFLSMYRRLELNPYSSTDADKDFKARDLQIKELADRLAKLEDHDKGH